MPAQHGAGGKEGRGWGHAVLPLELRSPQPVVTQVMPPGKSSVAWGRQTGATRAFSCAGVASLISVMSLRMVSALYLGFLKTCGSGSTDSARTPGWGGGTTKPAPVGTPGPRRGSHQHGDWWRPVGRAPSLGHRGPHRHTNTSTTEGSKGPGTTKDSVGMRALIQRDQGT